KANEQLQSTTSSLNTSSAMAAFERMEEKVLQMEATSQAAAELAGANLESQFASLEAGGDVDLELAAMKAQLSGGTVDQGQLPPGEASIPVTQSTEVDAELEQLRSQIDQLD
ncbi:MAG TPA: PspA/IM30 family protein, partial [Nodosilinea sp.]|nr:PspA/IM30 family protein [Nodosilinea sp.]